MASLVLLSFVIFIAIHYVTSYQDHPFCGLYHRPPPGWSGRIYYGSKTYQGQFPWVIGINYIDLEEFSLCNGAIITEKWFVTAAHCLREYEDKVITLFYGRRDLREHGTGGIIRFKNIWGVTTFKPGGKESYNKDIAFVKLPGPDFFPLPDSEETLQNFETNRICLNPLERFRFHLEGNQTILQMASFGTQAEEHKDLSRRVMTHLRGRVIDPIYKYQALRLGYEFAWSSLNPVQHSCPGDSGSPVIVVQKPNPLRIDIPGTSPLRAAIVGTHAGIKLEGTGCVAQPEPDPGEPLKPQVAVRFDEDMLAYFDRLLAWDGRSRFMEYFRGAPPPPEY